ncbi:MAG: hypothetical protein ABJN69_07510 [Hellea sp.]
MRRFTLVFFILMAVLLVLIFIYASLYRFEIVGEVFLEKITSPPARITALIFVVGTCSIAWKKLKLVSKSKGE